MRPKILSYTVIAQSLPLFPVFENSQGSFIGLGIERQWKNFKLLLYNINNFFGNFQPLGISWTISTWVNGEGENERMNVISIAFNDVIATT